MLREPHEAGELLACRYETGDAPEAVELPSVLLACFRSHPHVSNVLTHVGRASWDRVEKAIAALLDPATQADELSPLALNLLDLLCGERGVTGRILRPFFRDCLRNLVGPNTANEIAARLDHLQVEAEFMRINLPLFLRNRERRG